MPGKSSRRFVRTRSIRVKACARVDGPAVATYYPRWYTGRLKQAITEGQGK